MFTLLFLRASIERACKTAAQAALLVIGADQLNVMTADWGTVAGFAAGGAVLSLLTSYASGATGSSGPGLGDAEQLAEPALPDVDEHDV